MDKDRIQVEISSDSLHRLLRSGQLTVSDFRCQGPEAKQRVKRLFIDIAAARMGIGEK